MDRFQLQRAPTLSAQQMEDRLRLQEMFNKFEQVVSRRQTNTQNAGVSSQDTILLSSSALNNNNSEQLLKMRQNISRILRNFQTTHDSKESHYLQDKDSPFVKIVQETIGLEEQQQINAQTEANLSRLLKANPYFRKIKSIEQMKLSSQDSSDLANSDQIEIQEGDNLSKFYQEKEIDQLDLDDDLDFDSVSNCSSDEDSDSIIIIKKPITQQPQPLASAPTTKLTTEVPQQIMSLEKDEDETQYDLSENTLILQKDTIDEKQMTELETQKVKNISSTGIQTKSSGYRKKPTNEPENQFDFYSLNSMPTLDHF